MRPSSQTKVADLYRQYGGVIFHRCRALLKDAALAEDATQDVFVKAWRHLDGVEPNDALAWLHRIAVNHCLNVIRDRRLLPEPVDFLPDAPTEHPEPALLRRDLHARLLATAPDRVRATVVLRYEKDLDQEQIAVALGVARRTVVNHLNAFHDQARKALAEAA